MTCVESIGGWECGVCGYRASRWGLFRGHKNKVGETCSGGIA